MGANDHNVALKEALELEDGLKLRGFTAACGPTGGVVVDRWNHVRGVWDYHDGHFFWTDAGYTQPSFRVANLEGAVKHTHDVISKA